ncbi:MAG: hypothetical protein WCS75_14505 [Sphingomonas sp.]|jgi:hypothetical protein
MSLSLHPFPGEGRGLAASGPWPGAVLYNIHFRDGAPAFAGEALMFEVKL